MSDKKVIPIGGGGGTSESIVVDDALSTSSTNPVQNKVITSELNNKPNKATTLKGYGIGDAYTKTEVDGLLENAKDCLKTTGGIFNGDTVIAEANEEGSSATIGTVLKTEEGKALLISSSEDLVNVDSVVSAPSGIMLEGNNAMVAAENLYNVSGLNINIATAYNVIPTNYFAINAGLDTTNHQSSMYVYPGYAGVSYSDKYRANEIQLNADCSLSKGVVRFTANSGGINSVEAKNLRRFEFDYASLTPKWNNKYMPLSVNGYEADLEGNVEIPVATSTKGGIMSSQDKTKLDSITPSDYATKTELSSGLNGKADKATTLSGYGITNAYTKTEVDSKIASILDSAPETLNTLNELAAALGDDPNFATTVSTEIGKKANSADLAKVATSGSYTDLSNKPTIPTTLPASGGNADTVNGHTVLSDVPANAKFTDTVYTLPTASSTLGGVKTTSTVTSTSGLTACPIINGVPYYKDTNNTYTLSSFGVTATAAELNLLDGVTATTTELNYVDGVTSNIQTQLNGKLSTSGTAAKATADASGNTITSTYATKTELTNGLAGKLNTTGGNVTGHIYLTGAKESSSTGNTSQIVFGTSDNNHVAISSNNNALVINPSTSSAANQIVLYLDKASVFPGGISGNASSASKLTTNAGSTTQPVYFSNGVPVKTTYTLGKSVPSDAVFTDTVYTHPSTHPASMITGLAAVATSGSYNDLSNKPTIPSAYTLPNATSSVLGGVKVGTNISVSSGTISVANASTSAKGVVQLSTSTSSTSTSLAATASAVKSAYDLANGKQSPATTLAGYGITNAYTKTETDANFLGWNRGAYDVDTLVNAGIYMIASGSNAPSGSQYGSLLTMPYRSLTGNSTPDFGTQIFIPNGDDKTKPNSMFFRTSLSGSWNAWQEVATKSEFYTKEEVDSLVGKSLGMKATGSERTRASGKYNYGL